MLHLNSETTQALHAQDKKDLEMAEAEAGAVAQEQADSQQTSPFDKTVDAVDPFDSEIESAKGEQKSEDLQL